MAKSLPYLRSFLIVFTIFLSINSCADESHENMRQSMLDEIQQLMQQTAEKTGKASLDKRVADAMLSVPRHEFVPVSHQQYAYVNSALPISHEQTISQPYIVALMTDLAEVTAESIVLEVGTGSGYQAAVLSEITSHVYSIEIVEPLGIEAKARLRSLGYHNVTVKIGDGYYGWDEHAPFDAILVTAAPEEIPKRLIQQLKPNGRLVIPVGKQMQTQSLIVLTKGPKGEIEKRNVLPVSFVPFTGEH